MSPAWPTELRRCLYDAAAKNAETVPNPVRISITYPSEEITILDVDGTYRTVSVPPCNIVLTQDQLTPTLVPGDEPPSQSADSSQTWDSSAALASHEIIMSLEGAGTDQADRYVHATGGLSLPPNISTPAPAIGSVNPDVGNASPYPVGCHGCASASFLCESTAGFPCRGCADRNVPCVVTFYPQAPADAYGGSVDLERVDGHH